MTRPDRWRPDLSKAGLLLACACACAAPIAGALEIRPSVAVGAVYTNNLNLDPDQEKDDVVTRADPRLDISHTSPRVNLRADYTYSYLRFSKDEKGDASFSAGSAVLDLTLIKGLLTLETTGDVSQQLIDPEDKHGYNNIPIIEGRINQTVLETSPHLQTKLGSVGIDTQYQLGRINFGKLDNSVGASSIQDVNYQEAHTAIASEKPNKGLSWDVFHDYEAYKYEKGSDTKAQTGYLTLTYGLRQAGDFFVFGSGGLESDYRDITSASLTDSRWELGFRRVTSRTLVEASFGERSFGSTLNATVRRALNKGSIELAYREDPSGQEQLLQQRPRTIETTPPPPGVPDNIGRPGLGDRFVYRVLSATLLKEIGRNKIEVVAFNEERDNILNRIRNLEADPVNDPPVVQNSEKQTGIKGKASRQLGPRTTLGVEAEVTHREFRDGTDDHLFTGRLAGTYALGRKLSLEGYLARYQQRGSDTLSDNYTEMQAGLSANYKFR